MKKLWLLSLFLVATFGWAKPTIVVSIQPYYSLVQQLTGDSATVVRMLPPGASPHTFDPTPRDVAQLANANLVILNGVLDDWLLDLVKASGQDIPVLNIMQTLKFEGIAGDGHETPGPQNTANPHIWLDPELMIQAIPLIVSELKTLEPASAELLDSNAQMLITNLETLNSELAQLLSPLKDAAFVPFHDAWPYFARRYGLNLIVEIEPAPGREPSAAYIADALQKIADSGAKAIFSEVQLPTRPAEVVAENAGVALYTLDPLGGTSATQTYQDLLRYNASIIAKALGN